MQQRLSQPQPLRIAMREGTGPPVGIRCQTQALDRPAHGGTRPCGVQAPSHLQVLPQRQLRVAVRGLHRVADRGPRLPAARADPGSEHRGASILGLDHPELQPDGGGLACAVQTKARVDLSFGDPHGKVIHGGHITVAFPQILCFNRQGHGRYSSFDREVGLDASERTINMHRVIRLSRSHLFHGYCTGKCPQEIKVPSKEIVQILDKSLTMWYKILYEQAVDAV
jgi:hypothetical protein